jgi:ribosomal protein L11 methyltransferase
VFALTVECGESESEVLSAELWDAGATGIQEEPLTGGGCTLRAWFDDPEGLVERFHAYSPRVVEEAERDWEAVSREAWQPFTLGARLYLAPPWDASPTPDGRIRLVVHPGLALGTGAHPATQLALMALEREVRQGDTVVDVGTGSGILAAASQHFGARAIGCDLDADYSRIASGNLGEDGLTANVFIGSTRALRAQCADVVVANINETTHALLAPEYARVARRGLVLSGFPERRERELEEAVASQGFRRVDRLCGDHWVCLIFHRDTPCNAETS